MPGNIPKKIKRLDLYRENTFTATFVFPASYPSKIPTAKVERNDRLLTGVTPTLSAWSDATIEGQPKRIFSFTYTPVILDKMQGLCVHTFMLDGQAFAAGQVNSITGYGETDPVNYNVTLDGDDFIVIEVPGLDIVAGLAAEVAADRVQTGLDRVATGEDRVATGQDRTATATSEQNAATSATGANDAKVAAEATLPMVVENVDALVFPIPRCYMELRNMDASKYGITTVLVWNNGLITNKNGLIITSTVTLGEYIL